MSEPGSQRQDQADRIAPYFDLQLCLAAAVAALTGEAMSSAVARLTNFHPRFGLGYIGEEQPSPLWLDYLAGLDERQGHSAWLDWTLQTFLTCPDEAPSAKQALFGCFSYDPPNEAGDLKIHFNNRDGDPDHGPLSAARLPLRRAELRQMVHHMAEVWPGVRTVAGGSWLYNTQAYCSLFPADYVGSARRVEPLRLTGTSSWGQVLDFRGHVKPQMRDAVLAALPDIDPQAPWQVFPLRALAVRAPLASFLGFVG
jgi:hypothetical protein